MKKVIWLTLTCLAIFSVSFAERYPIEMEYNFLKGCIGNRVSMEDYCFCALRKIESNYTLGQFMALYSADPEGFKKMLLKEVIPACVDKL